MDDIVVTAQRREEKLQDVPIAITAISGARLEEQKIEDNYGLVALTPALTVNRGSATVAVTFLRGVGSPNVIAGDEPSVATYIDGFYQGPATSSVLPFINIDRVEVLKGPQGTLFGRNATGGLINLITATPHDSFFVKASLGYDNFRTLEANGYVSVPIGEKIKADLAINYRDQERGVSRNLFTGHRVGVDDGLSLRSKIIAELSDRTTLTLSGDYADTDASVGSALTTLPGTRPLASLVGGTFTTKPYNLYNNVDPVYKIKAYGASAKLESDLGGATFISMSQYRYATSRNILDTDGTSADNVAFVIQPGVGPFILPTLTLDSKLKMPRFITQEFQLLSNSDGPFSWIVGAFGQNSREGYDPISFILNSATGASAAKVTAFSTTTAYAGFVQGTYAFGDGLSLTAGGRYSTERKHATGSQIIGAATIATTDKAQSFDAFTYRLALDYKPSDRLLLYASLSKGFKSGTFNTSNIDAAPAVKPETLYDYEIGFKSDPSRGLRINGAAYYYDYRDIQYYSQSAAQLGVTILQNAAAATLYGVELDMEARPVRALTLTAAAAWQHSNYDSFTGAQVYINAPVAGQRQIFVDASGNPVIQAPEFTTNLGANYDVDLPNAARLSFAASLYHNSGYPFDPAGIVRQPSYNTVNGSMTLKLPGGQWSVTAWVKNLFDERYYNQFTVAGRGARVGYALPRALGVVLRYEMP
nr:TonB-dependent receptor [Sphingomonas sp. CDS-1]